ncbi:RNA-directed DNA polymerase, eukaryota [Tanacetum coccineum]|uniref:RNA-directed DNA polymerase, eukaryota n=1 Tax=Tanacetum coccineum TaxID=301880 RepID=A0ABQ4XKY8_9ASTR
MYGDRGSIDNPGALSRKSPWSDIIKEVTALSRKGINFLSFIKKKVGNGEHTCFWEDAWLDDCPLKSSFPRLYALENVKQVSVASKIADSSLSSSFRRVPRGGIEEEQLLLLVDKISLVLLSNSLDRWSWTLTSSGEFSVKSARNHIDDVLLPSHGSATRWVNKVPIKINILAWKVCKDILPTRFNLSLRGVDINSILCPVCHMAGESSSHLFFSCNVARLLFQKITRWWDLDVVDLFSYEDWISWLSSFRLSKGAKSWKVSFMCLGGLFGSIEIKLFSDLLLLKRIGDGSCTSFWYDIWLADAPLCVQFPRLFALELNKEIVVANKMGASSVSASFRQQWDDLSSTSLRL